MADAPSLLLLVLLSLGCHGPLSPFLPATFEPILLLYGQHHSPLVVALIAALTSVAAEYLNYYIYRRVLGWESLTRVMRSNSARAVTVLFARHPFVAVWTCAWSPVPDWTARILAAHSGYSVRRYLSAFLLGRVPKFWLIAQVGLFWMPSRRIIVGLVLASAVLTVLGVLRRRGTAGAAATATSDGPVLERPPMKFAAAE